MAKTLFIDKIGNVHFGMNAPSTDYKKAELKDVEKALKTLNNRKFWECTVCYDLDFNLSPPEECPTCHQIDAYKEITIEQFKKTIGLK